MVATVGEDRVGKGRPNARKSFFSCPKLLWYVNIRIYIYQNNILYISICNYCSEKKEKKCVYFIWWV